MEANDGVHRLRSTGPGLPVAAEPLGDAVDAIVRRARLIWWQSERLREAGELVVARLIELHCSAAPEGARG